MINLSESLTVTLPISPQAYQLAEEFSLHYDNPDKAKQVYLNTLAVWTVKFYLRCMGIETNWEASLSSNPAAQILMNAADLEVRGLGKIECCPILPTDNFVRIPLEDCVDRIGYVVVKLKESQKQATLLGFITTVPENGELAINQLQSINVMLLQLSQPTQVKQSIHLQQWLNNIFEAGWQSIEALVNTKATNLTFSTRTARYLQGNSTENSAASICGGKIIDWSMDLADQQVALIIRLMPKSQLEVDIRLRVYPVSGQIYLPLGLQLVVSDEAGACLQAQARSMDNWIQLEFSGEVGESFTAKVALGDVSVTEDFVI
jgi:hypothetical protein